MELYDASDVSNEGDDEVQKDQLDELIDDFTKGDPEDDPGSGDPADPEKDDDKDPEEDVDPDTSLDGDDKPDDDKDESEGEPEDDEGEGEGEPEPEPDDDLMDMSRKGLEKTIEKEGLNIEIEDEASEEDIRRVVREARGELSSDPAQQNQELRDWMNTESAKVIQSIAQQGQAAAGTQPQAGQGTQPAPGAELPKYELSAESFSKALESKEGFQEVLNEAMAIGEQRAIQRLGPMTEDMVKTQVALKTIVDDFYTDNPDLRPFKPFIGFLTQQASSQDPGKDFVTLLGEVAVTARKKIPELANPKPEGDNSGLKKRTVKPSFAGGKNLKGNRRGKRVKPLTGQDKHMDDVMTAGEEDSRF